MCQFMSLSPSLSKAMVNMSMCVPMCGLNVDYVSGRGLELDMFVWVLYITPCPMADYDDAIEVKSGLSGHGLDPGTLCDLCTGYKWSA